MLAKTGEELLNICTDKGISLSEYAILYEMESSELTREEVIKIMKKVMMSCWKLADKEWKKKFSL